MVAGVVAFVAAGAAAFWFLFVPNWRPPLRDGERYGVDVSAHQDRIDWKRVAGDDVDFAYIKATEGGDHVDRRFRENWAGAAGAGIERGVYHFFTLCRSGDEQARHFLAIAPPDRTAMAPAVDLELVGNCGRRPSLAAVRAELEEFLRPVEEAWGRPVVFYLGGEFEDRYPVRETFRRPLWLRRFLLRPSHDWRIWQLHGWADVDGVSGGVDLNVMRRR